MNIDNQSHKLALLDRDRGYRHEEGTPSLLYQARIAINRADLYSTEIRDLVFEATGESMAIKTIVNLMNGETQRPQLRTVELIMRALGYRMEWRK